MADGDFGIDTQGAELGEEGALEGGGDHFAGKVEEDFAAVAAAGTGAAVAALASEAEIDIGDVGLHFLGDVHAAQV